MPRQSASAGHIAIPDCSQGFDAQGNCKGGTVIPYNLASSTACGPPEPRLAIPGASESVPQIAKLWRMMPNGTDTSIGDGANTLGIA